MNTIAALQFDVHAATPQPTGLRVDLIRLDGGTQMRVGLSEVAVFDYAERLQSGDTFPSVVVFYDGTTHWLADGFHRVAAVQRLASETKHARWMTIAVDVHAGTVQDAVRFAISANRTSQLRRSNDDKRMAVRAALAHPDMQGMSGREIAKEVGVSHQLVNEMVGEIKRVASVATTTQPRKTTTNQTPSVVKIGEKYKNGELDRVAQKQAALDLAAKGMRVSDIASAIGRHSDTIRDWISNPAATPSTRGGRGSLPRKVCDADVMRLHDDGLSVSEIVANLKVSLGTINAARRRLGLGRAGKKAKNPLINHTERADADACAWEAGADSIVAHASVSSEEQREKLIKALSRLSKATATLKNRLNKDVGKGE